MANGINKQVIQVGGGSTNDKGFFADLTALQTAYPTGQNGWYAILGSTDTVWVWDSGTSAWKNTGASSTGDVSGPASSTDNALARFDSTTGKIIQNGIITETDTGELENVNGVQFDTTPTALTPTEGLLQWNATDGTLNLGMNGGDITQQIGQELLVPVRNNSGATILNGTVVYFDGSIGLRPTVALARSDAASTSMAQGITTQDILNNSNGFITTFGYVRQIKTNYVGSGIWGTTWVEGNLLYVSKTDAGVLTNVQPPVPHHSDIVGEVGVIGPIGTGSIKLGINRHQTLEDLSDVNGTPLTTSGQIPVWNQSTGYFDFTDNITTKQPLDAGLTSISALTGAGYVKATATDTFSQVTTIPNTDITGLGTLSTQNGTFSGTHSGTSSGTNTGDQTITLTGDISGTGTGSFATTIGALKVLGTMIANATIDLTTKVTGLLPFANIANVATSTVMYRKTAGTGAMEPQTLATLKTDLGLTGTNTGDNAVNTLYSGLVSNATHTGDATGATVLTLATVNSNVGSFGLASSVAQFVVNAKGLITSAANVAISIASTAISDFASASRAQTEAELIAGTNITITPSGTGATRQLTIASTGGGGGLTYPQILAITSLRI